MTFLEPIFHRFFYHYGGFIYRHSVAFVIIPVLVSLGLGSGLLNFQLSIVDYEETFAPITSKAIRDRAFIEGIYHYDPNDALLQESTRSGIYGEIIITSKDEKGVLDKSVLDEVLRLHQGIMDFAIHHNRDNKTITDSMDGTSTSVEQTYEDLCLKLDGRCHSSSVLLDLFLYNSTKILNGDFQYPIAYAENAFFIGYDLGGVTYNGSRISKVEAMKLSYYLQYETQQDIKSGEAWGYEFEEQVIRHKSNQNSSVINTYVATSKLLVDTINKATMRVLGTFSIAFCSLILFVVATCSMLDCVRSKTWLAFLGIVSAGMAVLSSFGLMIYIGVPFQTIVAVAPFLVLGIGIDDMFLMVAAWRKTDVTKTTEQRMKEAFSEAAMSITITSITDALAFGIGAITPFLSIRIFCLYTGVAVLFDYLFQITFFAGCMALMGYREEKNLHVLTCRRVLPKDEAPSSAYRIFCAGGSSSNPARSSEATQHTVMNFFRNTYGPFLTSMYVVPVVILVYLGYVAGSIWGITQLVEGLTLSRLAPDGSDAAKYYDISQEYFSTFGPPVAVVVTEEVDYSDKVVRDELFATLAKYENNPYFHDCCSTFWLVDYIQYLSLFGYHENIPSGAFYGHNLNMFLSYPAYHKYSCDIVVDNTTGRILSSRFYVLPKDVITSNAQKEMMLESRSISSEADIPMIAYSSVFPYFEQYVAVVPNTLQNLGIAVGAMLLVSIILLPSIVSSIVVCLSLVSVISGIIGFMSLWSVSLDLISMINLIISIGFTIDFSAHIIYAYLTAPESTPRKRAIYALYTMGMPIAQAASSTILAILILVTSDTYIFRCFFKVMFLVMIFGALHGLVFLPVFLMLFVRFKKKEPEVKETFRPRVNHAQNNGEFSYYQNVHDEASNNNHRTDFSSNI